MTDKIRTVNQLSDKLSGEIAWRKKELIYIKSLIQKNKCKSTSDALLRSGITILYAHWEGFIKSAATFYLEFISRQNLKYEELTVNFLAIAMKKRLSEAHESYKVVVFTQVADFFINRLGDTCSLPWEDIIKTSNLNSDILRDIVYMLGLDYSLYETKEKIIDESLLRSRNEIAHGRYLIIDFDQYMNLHHEVITLLDLFKNQIENASVSRAYILPKV
jgi:hypothetical protein